MRTFTLRSHKEGKSRVGLGGPQQLTSHTFSEMERLKSKKERFRQRAAEAREREKVEVAAGSALRAADSTVVMQEKTPKADNVVVSKEVVCKALNGARGRKRALEVFIEDCRENTGFDHLKYFAETLTRQNRSRCNFPIHTSNKKVTKADAISAINSSLARPTKLLPLGEEVLDSDSDESTLASLPQRVNIGKICRSVMNGKNPEEVRSLSGQLLPASHAKSFVCGKGGREESGKEVPAVSAFGCVGLRQLQQEAKDKAKLRAEASAHEPADYASMLELQRTMATHRMESELVYHELLERLFDYQKCVLETLPTRNVFISDTDLRKLEELEAAAEAR